MRSLSYSCVIALAVIACSAPAFGQVAAPAQAGWLKHGNFIAPGDLPPQFAAVLAGMGGRLMSAGQANVSIA